MYQMIDGKRVELTPEEEMAWQTQLAASEAEAPRRRLIERIAELEALQTPRRMREAALGIDDGWLNSLEEEITNLRASLSNL